MPTFQRCPESVKDLARDILCEFPTHRPLLDARVTVDYVFAFPSGQGHALTKNGLKCLGLCRIVPLKARVLGRADAEISLDAEWWEDATLNERRAVLDHELHHIEVQMGQRDDFGRPVLKLRKHDVEIGFFDCIAFRHGEHSQERIQAKRILEQRGQFYWPGIVSPPDPNQAELELGGER